MGEHQPARARATHFTRPRRVLVGVYYVDDGGIVSPIRRMEVKLEFMDPTWALPLMLAPSRLCPGRATFRILPFRRCGPSPAGVMFPAWLMHQVRPITGTASVSPSHSISRCERIRLSWKYSRA